uniref:60S ribosomal export protein NMD3 n=1 Tax=Babesia bovis TaxID=5865 RepID=A7ARX8_BABBO|eukprot:XP_001610865.1 nonsense-mediated mRNA decay protein [Babesia bovis T2Bo]
MADWDAATFASTEPSYAPMFCCLCGDVVPKPTASRMCHLCITKNVNLAQEVTTHTTILQCGTCKMFFHDRWLKCDLESKELLSICLKKAKGLENMKIINAAFSWTEPHSKQLKVKVCVQKEVDSNFVVEQSFVITFSIKSSQCDHCKRMYTPHTWKAMVQIRQKTKDKRHILMLEQIIIKHNAHENVTNILSRPNGFDLHFQSKTCAQKFADFVSDKIVSQVRNSKKLITQDSVNNKWDYKYTLQVQLIPICADDMVRANNDVNISQVFLPPKVASINGGISPFLLCVNLTTTISLIDPFTLRTLDISNDKFWKNPFTSRKCWKQQTDAQQFSTSSIFATLLFSILRKIGAVSIHTQYMSRLCEMVNIRCRLVDVELMAVNASTVIYTKSHLGNILTVGDTFSGYDIRKINLNGLAEEQTDISNKIPFDVILVRKVKTKKLFKTNWVLKRIVDVRLMNWLLYPLQKKGSSSDDEIEEDELLDFKEELINKKELQKNVEFYQNPRYFISNSSVYAKYRANANKVSSPDDGDLDIVASQLKELSLQDTNYF